MEKLQKKPKVTYEKKDPISHILERPDMYCGSTRLREMEEYVFRNDLVQKSTITASPAIVRIFIELTSNVLDNFARSRESGREMKKIEISWDKTTGETVVFNDGEFIPIDLHEKEKCYNHTLIFGHLLTGSNYDDKNDSRRDVSGRNGLGAKLTNVFSKQFSVEGLDPTNGKTFKQMWSNNMRTASEPEIKNTKLKRAFTRIVYVPDFSRFDLEGYTDDILDVYRKIVVDVAMITKIPVVLNGTPIKVSTLKQYAVFFRKPDLPVEEPTLKSDELYLKTANADIYLTPNQSIRPEFECISFANSIFTKNNGSHTTKWIEALFRPIVDKMNKPKKPQITISDVKKFFRLFIVATVDRPEFDSQTKSCLESPVLEADIDEKSIKKILKWPVIKEIQESIKMREFAILKKVEAKIRGFTKVEGHKKANLSGTKRSLECSLILVEGLSATTYASTGISKGVFGKTGPDYFGILGLRGKVLNVRNATPASVAKNEVMKSIIQCIGLRIDKDTGMGIDYLQDENFKTLRYGKVILICDADQDGIHITGLIQNFFHTLFPSLLKRNFLVYMGTLVVRVFGSPDVLFYDEYEYQDYVRKLQEKNPNVDIKKKYYKGLGSSNEEDIEETFGMKMANFVEDDKTDESMILAFHKKYANQRKDWMQNFDRNNTVFNWVRNEPEVKNISYTDFIDKEFIKYSIRNCARSIPNLMDGLKEGHRKILYVMFKRNLKYTGRTIKVAQLGGSVSEKTNYHHGEQNLYETIIGMAQAFVGSNNIPLLFRDGAFGSREAGGEDAASARYIWTKLDVLTRLIFRPEDDLLLKYIEEDGDSIEPEYYIPIVPMVLVNGATGIGTGWSTSIPCYNPIDLIESVKIWLEYDGKVLQSSGGISLLPDLTPWYRGHTGIMEKKDDGKYVSHGIHRGESMTAKIKITELPVGLWTKNYIDYLDQLQEEKKIKSYVQQCTPKTIDFTIVPVENIDLKLTSNISTNNMVLFDSSFRLRRYRNTDEIIDEFCTVRFEWYRKRKQYMLNDLENRIKNLGNKKRFLEEIRDGKLQLFTVSNGKKQSRKRADLEKELETRGYDKESKDETGEDLDDETEKKEVTSKGDYSYLLKLQISNITAEKIDKLERDILSNIQSRDELKSTTEKQLWIRDLDELKTAYETWAKEFEDKSDKSNKKKKPNKTKK